jgi:hypothetical protein
MNRCSYIGREVHINRVNQVLRAASVCRVPKWADTDTILSYYETCAFLSSNSEFSYAVDHIIPLNGEYVSGLHVPDNLQIIKSENNIIKGNKLSPSDLCGDTDSNRRIEYRKLKIENAISLLVDTIANKNGTIKLYKNGRLVRKKRISHAAGVRNKFVTDYLQENYG